MLLEVSGKGAQIDLGLIPKPDLVANNMTFEQWVKVYPGMGFVLTAKDRDVPELARRFASVGMTAKAIGTVDTSNELRICYNGDETQVFDFIHNGVMHLFSEDLPCRLH
jgi:selenophosphate synthetase-related protein